MAVIIETGAPRRLLKQIRAAIEDGTVSSWESDFDGDLSLTSESMRGQAWMRARETDGWLVFNIVGKSGTEMTKSVYAAYHSRLVQMCLTFFDESCRSIRVTPLPTSNDSI
jgi:hypothetical protein